MVVSFIHLIISSSWLVSCPHNTTYEGASGIDSLYTEILRHAYHDVGPDYQKPGNQEVYRQFRSVVGAVLLAFNPLSMKSLSSLLYNFNTPSSISTALNPLHSLLLIPEAAEDPVWIFHKSFPDFLMDPERYQDNSSLLTLQFATQRSCSHASS